MHLFPIRKKKKVLPQRVRQSRVGFRAGDELLVNDTRIEIFIFSAWISWHDTLLCLVVLVKCGESVQLSARYCSAHVCARKSLCAQVCVYVPQMASLGERCAFSVKELISTLFQLTAPVESKCLGRCRVYRLSETLVPSRKFKAHSFLASCCKSVTDSCNRSDAV